MRITHLSRRPVVVALFVFTTLGAFVAGRALAGGIPAAGAMTYAGTLQDASGATLSGDHNIEVKLWSMGSGGTDPLCTTGSQSVTLDGGRFSVALPDDCTDAVKANSDTWADVLVDGASLGRTKLGAVPYAVEAGHAVNADNATSAAHASTASAGDGTLQTSIDDHTAKLANLDPRVTALENKAVITTVSIQTAGPADAFHDACANGLNAQNCGVMAYRYCIGSGYIAGWFVGESADSNTHFYVACVK